MPVMTKEDSSTAKPPHSIQQLNPFQPRTVFHIETSRLTCRAKQMTGFGMLCNNGLNEMG